MQAAVDVGLPGLVAWGSALLLVVVPARQSYRVGQVGKSPYLAGLGAGLLASQVALIVHGLTNAVIWGTRPELLSWAVWGVGMAAERLNGNPRG